MKANEKGRSTAMSVYKPDIDINELFDMRERFIQSNDVNLGTRVLFQDFVQYFDLDRIFVGLKVFSEKDCVPIAEYLSDQTVNLFGDLVQVGGYAKYMNLIIGEHEQNYIKLADTNNYFTSDNYDELLPILSKLGYVQSDKGTPTECLLFCIKAEGSFSYMIMERYGEREKLFSAFERKVMADTYHMLRVRLLQETILERTDNELSMKNVILDNEQMAIYMVDQKEKTILYYNAIFKIITPSIYVGVKYDEIFAGNANLEENYQSELRPNAEILVNYILKTDAGDRVIYLIKKVVPLTLADGREVFVVYVKNTEDYIRQLEGIDLLTSAYSMKGLFSHYQNSIQGKSESDYMLCTFDVSKFKNINDTKGFHAGNTLLQKISTVLRGFIRTQELFCRMSGDQFAVLLQCNSNEEAIARMNGLFAKLEEMREESFSDVGIAYICGIVDVEKDVEINILMDRANIARKTAKGSHTNKIIFFDQSFEDRLSNEAKIESRISAAVENGEFTPYLQPKFNLKTMEICGAEALVRWITPTGMMFPDLFIPLFEKNGFITTLDFIVYKKVMEHIRSCLDKNIKVYPISLNVSRNHIHNKNFATQILALVDEYKIPLELLELEITESVFVEDREVLKFFVDNIKHIKIKVSIDDFGSAYSSLQVLKDIHIDILKIDKGFLDNIGTDTEFRKDELVLKNIIRLAKDLHCKVICEGVETEEQIEVLKGIGCELGQGYVFARPMPIQEYEEKFLRGGK